jgi:hypothetical protein
MNNHIRVDETDGECSTYEGNGKCMQSIFGTSVRRRLLGRIILEWILTELGCEVVGWIQPATATGRCEAGNEPSGSIRGDGLHDWLCDDVNFYKNESDQWS